MDKHIELIQTSLFGDDQIVATLDIKKGKRKIKVLVKDKNKTKKD